MAREKNPVGLIIVLVSVALVLLGFAVHATLNTKKWHANFSDEMAQRLDLEEKLSRIEKDRAAQLSDLKSLSQRLEKDKTEIEDLKAALAKMKQENEELLRRLEQSQPAVTAAKTT